MDQKKLFPKYLVPSDNPYNFKQNPEYYQSAALVLHFT